LSLKSESRSSQVERDEVQENPGRDKERKDALKVLGGRFSCMVGILLGVGGIILALLGASDDVSSGVLAMVLGVLGYSLGARRLGAATVVLGTVALFFVVAASTGLIPGVAPLGHGYDG
jgi:Ca2+/Na+ antiporter